MLSILNISYFTSTMASAIKFPKTPNACQVSGIVGYQIQRIYVNK